MATAEVVLDRMNVPTPSTGPSMSPNTVPSEVFGAAEQWDDDEADEEYGRQEAKEAEQEMTREMAATLVGIQNDNQPRVVLATSCGWTAEACRTTVLPMLCHTKNAAELILVDLLSDEIVMDACAVLASNPSITSLVLISSGRSEGLTVASLGSICSLVYRSPAFAMLSLMNCLHSIAGPAMQMLGDCITYTHSLRSLNLESNNIQDSDFLPLAQGLASQRSIVELCLDNNSLHYQALDMMSEVMSYNNTLQTVSVSGNLVRCATDLWEGYYIQEQCKVNREVVRLGLYRMKNHSDWPSLWRRKMRKLWYVCSKLEATGKADCAMWEAVLQWMEPRAYIEQQVKLWMKLEPPPTPAPQIWRHT